MCRAQLHVRDGLATGTEGVVPPSCVVVDGLETWTKNGPRPSCMSGWTCNWEKRIEPPSCVLMVNLQLKQIMGQTQLRIKGGLAPREKKRRARLYVEVDLQLGQKSVGPQFRVFQWLDYLHLGQRWRMDLQLR